MLIHIKDTIGSQSAISARLGELVRDAYGEHWHTDTIELDFSGVRSVSPSFLSQATMPIILSAGQDEVASKVVFRNVPSSFDLVWQTVIRAAEAIRNNASNAA